MSMTQIWVDDKVVGVTPVQAGPCVITQVKNTAKDGYVAVQLAYGTRQAKNINKPQLGHYKKTGTQPAYVREFRLNKDVDLKEGDVITAGTFAVDDIVAVTGIAKGKGFQGVVKRHGFSGHSKTHGNKDQERMPGSIGPKGPAHVFKGTRMGGRMGGGQITTSNLKIKAVDTVNNILFIQGAIPGSINGYVVIKGLGELQVNLQPVVTEAPKVIEEANTSTEEAVVSAETPVEEISAQKEIKEEKKEETLVKEEPVKEEIKEEKKEEVKDTVVEENKSDSSKQ